MRPSVPIDKVRAQRLHDPDRQAGGGRNHRLAIDHAGRGRDRGRRQVGVGYTYSGASIAQLIDVEAGRGDRRAWTRWTRRRRGAPCSVPSAISAAKGSPPPRYPRSMPRSRISRRACSVCRLATLLGALPRCGADLRQRRLHHLFRRRTRRANSAAGSSGTAAPASR